MRFVDWFAGVGGIRLGLERAGLECAWSCEIDPFARAVYAGRFGREPEAKDIQAVSARDIPDADLWCGGFPCTDLSAAGRRAGIRGERSGLVWRLLDLAAEREPEWILLENVRGLLTGVDDGVDDGAVEPGDEDVGEAAGESVSWFGELLGALVERGYVGCSRVLDAQFFGVPQRRRRVFIVARHSRARGEHPGELLLERAGVRGDLGAGRAPRAELAGAVADGARVGGAVGLEGAGRRVAVPERIASTLGARYGTKQSPRGDGCDNLVPCAIIPFDPTQLTHPENRSKCEPGAPAPALAARARAPHIAYPFVIFPESGQGSALCAAAAAVSPTLMAVGADKNERGVRIATGDDVIGWRVRRLTPRECERLQGLPDDWTLIPGASMTQRYRVVGNSVAEPVIYWIARAMRWGVRA